MFMIISFFNIAGSYVGFSAVILFATGASKVQSAESFSSTNCQCVGGLIHFVQSVFIAVLLLCKIT
jgi:hypothetical protein